MDITIDFTQISEKAGFPAIDGRVNLPATQEVAEKLGAAMKSLLPAWGLGSEPVDVTVTGAGPVWAYMVLGRACHGAVRGLRYTAPNTTPEGIWIFRHGTF